jgi:glycosyltransferase involved in cell wall biosynthesis
MKVLLVTCSNLTNFDGKSIRLLKYADLLYENGYEVEFIVLKNEIENKEFKIHNTNLIFPEYLGDSKYVPFLSELWNSYLTSKFGLLVFVRIFKGKYELIISSTMSPEFGQIFTILGSNLIKAKHIYDYDDLAPEYSMVAKGWSQNHPFIKIQLFFEKFICRHSLMTIVMSESMKNKVARSTSLSKIDIIYNLPYKNEVKINSIFNARNKLKLEQNQFIFCYIGNVQNRIRSLVNIVEATEILSKEKLFFKILIIGTGSGMPVLLQQIQEKKIDDYFLFSGKIERDEVIDYVNAANVSLVLLPESIVGDYMAPGKLFISMGLGKNIIATRTQEIKNILKENALYVNPNPKSFELAEVMKKAIEIFSLTEINSTLIQEFQEEYNWDAGSEIFKKILNSI